MSLREALGDLVAILESPHTSVNVRWECGAQYKTALAAAKNALAEPADDAVRQHLRRQLETARVTAETRTDMRDDFRHETWGVGLDDEGKDQP